MPNNAVTDNRTEAARAFVEHLRSHPGEADQDPAALAERFGLETEFVRRALTRIRPSDRLEPTRGPSRLAEGAGGLVSMLDGFVERAARNPIAFEGLTLALAIVAISALSWAMPTRENVLFLAVTLSITLLTVGLQMVVFYRRRMARYALSGGLVFGVGTAIPLMVSTWLQLQRQELQEPLRRQEVTQGFIVLVVGLVMLGVGVLYAGVAALSSLAGGYMHLRRQEQEWERLSRQELLERYFELQRRLDRSVAQPERDETWEAWPAVAEVRRRPELAGFLLGLLTGLLRFALMRLFGAGAGDGAFLLIGAAVGLIACALFLIVAFLAGRATRGASAGAAFIGGAFVALLLTRRPAETFSAERIFLEAAELAIAVFAGALAGVGATIQRRAAREGRLQRNDGATLVAEMLEIQWRLEEDATRVTVVVVDAAKSTSMKVGADPLDVEYSFREYQMWIAEQCAEFGGRIHSVAGDGAVVAFSEGASAMAAARRLQTDVVRFNRESNRLPKPFRLRLGLHAGQVAGDLNDVQFTEVIDIAAHVEEIAPVGGIAATAAVVDGLGHEGFLPLSRDVDGQGVFIALVPTEG